MLFDRGLYSIFTWVRRYTFQIYECNSIEHRGNYTPYNSPLWISGSIRLIYLHRSCMTKFKGCTKAPSALCLISSRRVMIHSFVQQFRKKNIEKKVSAPQSSYCTPQHLKVTELLAAFANWSGSSGGAERRSLFFIYQEIKEKNMQSHSCPSIHLSVSIVGTVGTLFSHRQKIRLNGLDFLLNQRWRVCHWLFLASAVLLFIVFRVLYLLVLHFTIKV